MSAIPPAKPPAQVPQPAPVAQPAAMTQPAQVAQTVEAMPVEGVAEASGEEQEAEPAPAPAGGQRFILFNAVPSWFISMVVHGVLLVVLGIITVGDPVKVITEIVMEDEPPQEEIEEFEVEEITPIDVQSFDSVDTVLTVKQTATSLVEAVTPEINPSNDLDVAPAHIELSDFGERTAPRDNLLEGFGKVKGTGLSGRGGAAKGDMVRAAGGTEGSEAAVALALQWLAAHQLPDGGWNFDHTIGPGVRASPDPGSLVNARNGATGMALLPFLGAGQTHKEGKYKQVVYGGLQYLVSHMKLTSGGGGSLVDGGNLYSHGICAIVLCEAYAMTQDKSLLGPAQAALNYTVIAQDPVGGGWRYSERQAGDTSAVGWQLMALKSGHLGYLNVPPNTVRGAVKFLDSVSADSGSSYGYTSPGKGQATTAIGLLSRMYLGWKKENPALQRGVEQVAKWGPSGNGKSAAMYYNYYATQVMRHWGGDEWEKWNPKMRDFLVNSQAKDGPSKGSWHFDGDHGAHSGGRIYCTSLATMILEVYYRHMPIYQTGAAEEDFAL